MKLGETGQTGGNSPIGSARRLPVWVENVKSEDSPQSVVREEASGWVENVKSEDFPQSVVREEASGFGKNIKPEDFPQVKVGMSGIQDIHDAGIQILASRCLLCATVP